MPRTRKPKTSETEAKETPSGETEQKQEDPEVVAQRELEEEERERAEQEAKARAERDSLSQKPFKVKLSMATFSQLITASVALAEEAVLELRPEGIRIMVMDPGSISMVKAEIPSRYCMKYEQNDNRIGLNLENIDKILARNKKEAEIELSNSPESSDKLRINLILENKIKSYTAQIIDIRKNVEKEPSLEYKGIMGIKAYELLDLIREAELYSGYLNLSMGHEEFLSMAKGDAGKFELRISRESPAIGKYNVQGSNPINASFNLEFLKLMVAPANDKETEIELRLKDNEPLRMRYMKNECEVIYHLAPYMEE